MIRANQISILAATILLLSSCGGDNKSGIDVPKNAAVCIWDNASLKETPEEKGKWLSSISIGEYVTNLKETSTDESAKKPITYIKVRLKDGKEGWVHSDLIVVDARPAVITAETPAYSRPDLLNKTDKVFDRFDIVAVKSENNGFLEVVGKRNSGKWIETLWIKNNSISYTDVDIAVAKYAKKALSIKNDEERINAISEIVKNPDFSQSVFIEMLTNMIDSYSNEGEEIDSVLVED